jgi:hypothetical protein
MFVRVVIEQGTYHICEVVIQTIKIAARNLSGVSNFTA